MQHLACWQQIINVDMTLTTTAYSTLMMGQSRMDGDTGGILSILPSQLWLLPCGRGSPLRLDTSCWICLPFPLAKKVWFWYRAALGTTTRDEQFSTSAKICIDSPWRKGKRDQPIRLREKGDKSKRKKKRPENKSWSRRRVERGRGRLTWCVALSLYFGTERDRTRGAEPAAQSFLLCPSLRSLRGRAAQFQTKRRVWTQTGNRYAAPHAPHKGNLAHLHWRPTLKYT